MYKVLRAPGGRIVYTIAPVNDPHQVKHVYRSLLKSEVDRVIDRPSSEPPQEIEPPPVDESLLSGEWFVLFP